MNVLEDALNDCKKGFDIDWVGLKILCRKRLKCRIADSGWALRARGTVGPGSERSGSRPSRIMVDAKLVEAAVVVVNERRARRKLIYMLASTPADGARHSRGTKLLEGTGIYLHTMTQNVHSRPRELHVWQFRALVLMV